MDEHWIHEELRRIRDAGLERTLAVRLREGTSTSVLNLSSNDYLNLSRHPCVVEGAQAALSRYGASSAASRLVSGTAAIHEELESELARYLGCESVLVLGSGYHANMAVLSALAGRSDLIVADKLVHASLLDGAHLSGAKLLRFRHNDTEHLEQILAGRPREAGRVFVVTESVFSMDGDLAPIADLAGVCERHGAIFIVDEAHALGIFGKRGTGVVDQLGLAAKVPIRTATLSKAFGSFGGIVASSRPVRELIVNRARPFIFSTGLPPASAGSALAALKEIEAHPEWGGELLQTAERFRSQLSALNPEAGDLSRSQIVPFLCSGNEEALALAAYLREREILAVAIRPPTVPPGTERIRFSVTRAHGDGMLDFVTEALRDYVSSRQGRKQAAG